MKDYKMAVKEGTAKKKAPVKKKTVAKKPLAKKAAVKKAPAKKKVITKKAGAKKAATPFRRATAISERYNKVEIVNELALNSGLNRKQIDTVLDELCLLVQRHVKKRAVGEFILSGLVKITTVKKPAKKARKGINTFTGKETIFKAKPATNAVKVYALKGLRDMAN
jgi:nucleoid DNA-binding protein